MAVENRRHDSAPKNFQVIQKGKGPAPCQPSPAAGMGSRNDTMTRAEGPTEHAACGPNAMIGRAFSPQRFDVTSYPGRWPGLAWYGPLARKKSTLRESKIRWTSDRVSLISRISLISLISLIRSRRGRIRGWYFGGGGFLRRGFHGRFLDHRFGWAAVVFQ